MLTNLMKLFNTIIILRNISSKNNSAKKYDNNKTSSVSMALNYFFGLIPLFLRVWRDLYVGIVNNWRNKAKLPVFYPKYTYSNNRTSSVSMALNYFFGLITLLLQVWWGLYVGIRNNWKNKAKNVFFTPKYSKIKLQASR